METVLAIILSNALVVPGLALLAFGVSRFCRRPALAHGMWLLVLLKLLTPPLFRIPVSWQPPGPIPAPSAEPVAVLGRPAEDPVPELSFEEVPQELAPAAPWPMELPSEAAEPVPAAPVLTADHAQGSGNVWLLGLIGLWIAGSLGWLFLLGLRVWALRRLFRFARAAPDWLNDEVQGFARQLGLSRPPRVLLVPGKVSPMLWSLGGSPRLILPEELLASLSPEERSTLLVHELAHLARRDHWVRWLELLTTAVYWWHPVVWWARRELREAEEQCCDAWVVWALPGAGRTYAAALLECLDFLSEDPRPLPAGASGVGHIADLKRRLIMIMKGTTPRCLSRGGLVILLGAALLLLPWLPTQADERPEGRKEERREERKEDRKDERGQEKKEERKGDPKEIEKAQAEVEKLLEELTNQVRKVRELEEKIRAASQQLERAGGRAPRIVIEIERRRIEGDRERPREGDRPRDGERPRDGNRPRDGERPREGERPRDGERPREGRPGEDRRIQDLERKLDDVLRELNELRRQMRGGRPGEPVPPGARPMGPRERGPADQPGDNPERRRPNREEEEKPRPPRERD